MREESPIAHRLLSKRRKLNVLSKPITGVTSEEFFAQFSFHSVISYPEISDFRLAHFSMKADKPEVENCLNRVEKCLADVGLGPIDATKNNGVNLEQNYIDNILTEKKRSVQADGAAKLDIALEAPPEYLMLEMVVPFDDTKYRRAAVFARNVQGNACNLRSSDGAKMFVVPAAEKGVRDSKSVVVRNYDITGKAETTIKQVALSEGKIELCPRSTAPKCQSSVALRDRDETAQDGSKIWAVVVGAYQPEEEGAELISPRSYID